MQHRAGSMEYDYPINPKSVLYSVSVPVKDNIILVSKSMYKYIPLLKLWVLNKQVYTSTYYYIFSKKVYTSIYWYILFHVIEQKVYTGIYRYIQVHTFCPIPIPRYGIPDEVKQYTAKA